MIFQKRLLILPLLLLASTPAQTSAAQEVTSLRYDPGVMERVARCHMRRGCGTAGDYVPTLRLRPDRTCLTAVRYADRGHVASNAIYLVRFYNPVTGLYGAIERCQPVDWQQKRHATSYRRLEVDAETARRNGFYRAGKTSAIIVQIITGKEQ